MKITGRCHCGAIAYEAEVDPNSIRVCHCTDCQRLTGTAFRSVIASLPGSFALKRGTPKIYIKTAESGTRRAHGFCAECGTSIYATSLEAKPQVYLVPLGAAVGDEHQRRRTRRARVTIIRGKTSCTRIHTQAVNAWDGEACSHRHWR